MTIAQIQTAIDTDITSKVAPNSITPTNVGAHLAEQAAQSYTRANLLTAIAANELVPGALIEISDRGDLGLYFYAVKDNELSATGWRRMLCPKIYSNTETADGNEWKGVWSPTKLVLSGDLMIWGGKVWQNGTGAIGTATSFYELDNTNWTEITKTGYSNEEYTEMVFGCIYDLANDHIAFQWDAKGNKAGCTYEFLTNVDGGAHLNYCDETDWNAAANNDGYMFENNEAMLIGNNVLLGHMLGNRCPIGVIANNRHNGTTSYNQCFGAGSGIFDNSNNGDIANNVCDLIQGNTNNGVISGNKSFSISLNSNDGAITGNISGNILSNSNDGDIDTNICISIDTNANTGSISYNHCTSITNNGSDVTQIRDNYCEAISANTNNGSIIHNSAWIIQTNNNAGNIQHNRVSGSIEANTSNVVDIQYNQCLGGIASNSNTGDIEYNANAGAISTNSNTGYIRQNTNNGDISTCSGASNIFNNINNGTITGAHGADVSDAVVNK